MKYLLDRKSLLRGVYLFEVKFPVSSGLVGRTKLSTTNRVTNVMVKGVDLKQRNSLVHA